MKIYDLNPDHRMAPVIGLLHAAVTYNYERLLRLVDGLTQDEIEYKGADGEHNSIAQLLRHLAVVDLHWVYRLQSSDIPADLKAVYGPMYDQDGRLPAVSNVSLAVLLEQYAQTQQMLKDVCLTLTDDDLCNEVPFEQGDRATVRWGIWHVADHSRHHYAQIFQMKKTVRRRTAQ